MPLSELFTKSYVITTHGGKAMDFANNPNTYLTESNSYLRPDSSSTNTDNLWNFFAFELTDLVEILEYLKVAGLSSVTIKGYTYTKDFCFSELQRRAIALMNIMNDETYDQLRNQYMKGLSQPLSSGYTPALEGKIFYHIMHSYQPLEPVARFMTMIKKDIEYQDFITNMSVLFASLFDQFEQDFENGTYIDRAEEAYQQIATPGNVVGDMAYNMQCSIGLSLYQQFNATQNQNYIKRVLEIAKYIDQALYTSTNTQYYSKKEDRVEDPYHATEVLRFIITLEKDGFFSTVRKNEFVQHWLTYGVDSNKEYFMNKLDPTGIPETITTDSLAHRFVDVYQQDDALWQKVLF